VEEAAKLIAEGDVPMRIRAAWILADNGGKKGVAVLEEIATVPTDEEDVIAIEALGRLRVVEAHPLLRALLERELQRALVRPAMPPRVSALIRALADYGDATDAALMAPAVERWLGRDSWPYVDALGKTAGAEAIPVLLKAFNASSHGITMVMAGLALARCGSPIGQAFVRSRIDGLQVDTSQPLEPEGRQVGEWILENLGTPQDEGLAPSLVRLVEVLAPADRTKALALASLLRINPALQRERVLAVAWQNTRYQAAVRLIALDDEATAREALAQRDLGVATLHPVADVYLMRTALDTSDREKRRWREIHGYTF
jgi:parvulin-like peptidyl-prolyl isomerase